MIWHRRLLPWVGPGLVLLVLPALALPGRAQEELEDGDLLGGLVDVTPVGDARLRSTIDASRDLSSPPLPALRFPLAARAGVQAAIAEDYSARVIGGATSRLGARDLDADLFVDEAFIEARLPWSSGLARLRFGRQQLELHGGRLVSANSFLDRPTRLDALRFTAGMMALEVDAFAALLDGIPRLADTGVDAARPTEDIFGGLSLSGRLGAVMVLEGHLLGRWAGPAAQQDDPTTELDERQPRRIATAGANLRVRPSSWIEGRAGLSYQLGEARSLEDASDLALGHEAVDLSLGLGLIGPWRGSPTLRIGFDLTSGDRGPFDNRSQGFDNPIGAVHGRYGAADLLRPSNAQDLYAALSVEEEGSRLALSLHRLALAAPQAAWIDGEGGLRSPVGGDGDPLLGHEVDLEGRLALADAVALELLYAVLLPDGLALRRVGAEAPHRLLAGLQVSF